MRYLVLQYKWWWWRWWWWLRRPTLFQRSQLPQLHSVQLHHCMTLTDTTEQSCLYTLLIRAKLYG